MVLIPALFKLMVTGIELRLWQFAIVPPGFTGLKQAASLAIGQANVPGVFLIAMALLPTAPNGPRARTLNQCVCVLKAFGTTNEVVEDVPTESIYIVPNLKIS